MNRTEAERHLTAIEVALSSAGYRTDDKLRYAHLEIVERDGDFRVCYRNVDKGFGWELTDARPEIAATAIRRWNSRTYRALRDSFEALLSGAPDYEWLEPQLDKVKVIAEPFGVFSIDAVGEPPEYRLMWGPTEGSPVDLSDVDPEAAVRSVFGESGVEAYRKWADFLPSVKE